MIVEQFLRWMSTAGPGQRAMAAGPLVRAYLEAEITPEERDGLEAVMTVLLDDADPAVRRALAEALAAAPGAPHHVVLCLAQDRPDVAVPVIARSPLLREQELVDLVALGGPDVQAAAASRPNVSAALAAALAEVGEAEALVALLENERAAIAQFSLERIVERAGDDGVVRDALLARPGVPIAVRQSLLDRLSAALKDLVVTNSWIGEGRADLITREAKDKATVALATQAEIAEVRPLVEHLRATGQLTTTLLLRAACQGSLRFVEEALASLAGVPAGRVYVLLADGREASFRALYRRSGMPMRAYPAFQAALEVNRELRDELGDVEIDDQQFARAVIQRVLARCEAGAPGEFAELAVLLRRFAAEAARDAARRFVSRAMERPLALQPPSTAAAITEDDIDADIAAALAAELGDRSEAFDAEYVADGYDQDVYGVAFADPDRDFVPARAA